MVIGFQRCRVPKLLAAYSVRTVFVQCMVCPIAALVLSFIVGSLIHSETLYNYRWTCGIVHLPSISRVMNMPLERIIFQLLILFSVPFRLFVLLKHWMEFSRKEAPRLYLIARKMLVVSGLGEVLFLSLLTVIGERESGDIHVLLFTAFAVFSYIYFVVMSLLTRWTYPGAEQESLRKKLQLGFLSAVTFTIPVIFVLFVLYNVLCVPTRSRKMMSFEHDNNTSCLLLRLN
ncbi:hypothetical protein RB195_014035 [Necator americanus]|uniref:CWH43-like N-terminal domain-containing protein n=1 Tax=Necator americanus TaxID=51031 RepID=A0ABR1DYT7_NECAM